MKKINLIFGLLFCMFLSTNALAADDTKTWTVSELMQSLGGSKKIYQP